MKSKGKNIRLARWRQSSEGLVSQEEDMHEEGKMEVLCGRWIAFFDPH